MKRENFLLPDVAVLVATVSAGRLGGELVYDHGAASGYLESPRSLGILPAE